MLVELPGGYRGVGAPVKLARTPATYRTPPLAEGVPLPAEATGGVRQAARAAQGTEGRSRAADPGKAG
jgi:hypothetical protein